MAGGTSGTSTAMGKMTSSGIVRPCGSVISGADVFLSIGSGFQHAGSWTTAGLTDGPWYVGDFDGDGKDDIFRHANTFGGSQMFLSSTTAFLGPSAWTLAVNRGRHWAIGDFNGDHKTDILRVANQY